MKRLITLFLALVCMMSLVACNNENAEQISTYSFRGEHDCFEVLNGSIVLSGEEEKFNGGNLSITRSEMFEDVASYSTTYYVLIDGVRKTILSNSVIDETGNTLNIEREIGSISGEGAVLDYVKVMEKLKETLWFELKTTDLDGHENVYQIKLTVEE